MIIYRQPIINRNGDFIEWFYWGEVKDENQSSWTEPCIHLSSPDTRLKSQKYIGMVLGDTRIFEGDILEAKLMGSGKTVVGPVMFDPAYGCYGIGKNGKLVGSSGSSTRYKPYTWNSYSKIRLIGNITEHGDKEWNLKPIKNGI